MAIPSFYRRSAPWGTPFAGAAPTAGGLVEEP
jgi:hypothetical protein